MRSCGGLFTLQVFGNQSLGFSPGATVEGQARRNAGTVWYGPGELPLQP